MSSSVATTMVVFVAPVVASARANIVVCNNARSDDPAFRKNIDDLLSRRLLGETPGVRRGEEYAALERGAGWVAYGKAKCTRGFTRCINCIDDAWSAFGKQCPGAWAAHLADGSDGCLVQYELSDFQL